MSYASTYSETGWGQRSQLRTQGRQQTRPQTRVETGFISDAIKLGGSLVDTFAGGPQKRERAAKAERDAEALRLQTAALELETAKLQAPPPPPAITTTTTTTKKASFLTQKHAGIPTWGWGIGLLAVGGLAFYALKD